MAVSGEIPATTTALDPENLHQCALTSSQTPHPIFRSTGSNHGLPVRRGIHIENAAAPAARQTGGSPVAIPLVRRRTNRNKRRSQDQPIWREQTDRCRGASYFSKAQRSRCDAAIAKFV